MDSLDWHPSTAVWPGANDHIVNVRTEVALLDIKSSFSNWPEYASANNVTGWVKGTPVCNWTGVTCTDHGLRVKKLCAPRH